MYRPFLIWLLPSERHNLIFVLVPQPISQEEVQGQPVGTCVPDDMVGRQSLIDDLKSLWLVLPEVLVVCRVRNVDDNRRVS